MIMYGVRCTESLIQRFVWVLHLAECVLVPRKQSIVSGIFLTRSAHCSRHGVSWCHMFLSTLAGIDWRDLVEPLILGVFGALSLCSVGKSGDIWWLMVTSRPYVRRLQDLMVPYTQMLCIPRWCNGGPMSLAIPHSSPKTSGVNTWIGVGAWLLWFGLHSSCWVYLGSQRCCRGWAWLDERSVIQ